LRVFITRWFDRYAKKEEICEDNLKEAIHRAENGLVDAELGGNLLKIRIARKGHGRSSGYRTLIAYKKNKRAVFLYGFAKSERENINHDELASLKELASAWMNASDEEINRSLLNGALKEVNCE
jgi:hypothetical protein